MRGMNFGLAGKLSIFLGLLAIVTIMVMPAYADQVVQPISGSNTLEVGFSTDPANPTVQSDTYLLINFIDKSTQKLFPHIDYQVAVKEGNNQICGTGIQHTAEGSVTNFKCQFPDAATYQVVVEIDGVTFQPITPVTATFTVNLGGGSTPSTNSTSTPQTNGTQNTVIPAWIKNNAKWWSEGQLGDDQFIQGLQYMIQHGIIQIPTQPGGSATSTPPPIPAWIKTNAGWWASGQITDGDFVKGIQWLITNGIIVV